MFHENTEYSLNGPTFKAVTDIWGIPGLDLFASRCNHKVEDYCSWKPDPQAFAVDAFSTPWSGKFYAFPPFCMIGRVLRRIEHEQACLLSSVVIPDGRNETSGSTANHMHVFQGRV